jgi:hypothetical protein
MVWLCFQRPSDRKKGNVMAQVYGHLFAAFDVCLVDHLKYGEMKLQVKSPVLASEYLCLEVP